MTISARFTKAYPFSDGIAAVQTPDTKWGFLNTQGNVMIAPKFERVANFTGGLAEVSASNKHGLHQHHRQIHLGAEVKRGRAIRRTLRRWNASVGQSRGISGGSGPA